MLLYIWVVYMSENLEKFKDENKDNMLVGFCLELKFMQSLINQQIRNLISFIEDNSKFFNKIDLYVLNEGLDSLIDVFTFYTDLIYNDVDFNEIHCKFHKDFY